MPELVVTKHDKVSGELVGIDTGGDVLCRRNLMYYLGLSGSKFKPRVSDDGTRYKYKCVNIEKNRLDLYSKNVNTYRTKNDFWESLRF